MHQILQPPHWAAPRGYVNGVAARGTQVFVAGQIGWNAQCEFESDDLVAQTRQALLNVRAVLGEAGAAPEHIVRMTWYLLDRAEYLARAREIGAVFREAIGSYAIAMTAVQVAGLIEAQAKVEIEVTAVVPG
jgi:enamine deaminase RidA (YjgF/YER057c/UK114 family)